MDDSNFHSVLARGVARGEEALMETAHVELAAAAEEAEDISALDDEVAASELREEGPSH